ncbi:MAG: hypothetical protein M1825_001794 [Sarcosagium campestre]|nr:MAG: hypothetical protein M1825_001794 [Sarcosagium campestre]
MAILSREDRAIIAKHPLNHDLDQLRASLREVDQNYDERGGTRDSSASTAASKLLATFLTLDIVSALRSKTRSGNLASELLPLLNLVHDNNFNYGPYRPLFRLVIEQAPDVDIWNAIFDLIQFFSPTTPPPTIAGSPPFRSIRTTFDGTPRVRSSASFRDSQQTRNIIRTPILEELSGRTFVDVKHFYTKYFENREWSKVVEQIYKDAPNNDPLDNFPEASQPEELDIWTWLDDFQTRYLVNTPGLYSRAKSKKEIAGALGERQVDIILKDRTALSEEPHNARDFRVIGELTKTNKSATWKAKFTQLAIYIRDTFAAQPTRWFVHGFLMFGTQMQLWIFDRSGAYSSETFDVRKEPKQFIHVLVGYASMTKAELGLDTFIQGDAPHPTVILPDAITGKDRALQLEAPPIFSQNAIACRGTSCFRTVDGTKVVKLSWRPDKRRSEVDHLTMARGVKGIPTLVGSRNVTTIEDLRMGLEFRNPKFLQQLVHDRSNDSLQSAFTGKSTQGLAKLDTSSNKRKYSSTEYATSKKRGSSSQKSNLRQEVPANDVDSAMPKQSSSWEAISSTRHLLYRNRVLTCLAVSPAGRPLQEFRSALEVLQAFRDAIRAHRELFLERRILHRDISLNNIILTDPKKTGGCSGMLIDLDLAVSVGEDDKNETSEERNMTGTLEYMAIQILEGATTKETAGTDHTYRHDLESFFYVFLSLCIRYGWPAGMQPKTDPLIGWYSGDLDAISVAKRGYIEAGGFKKYVLGRFSPEFQAQKELAKNLRIILFGEGELYIETPEKPARLYDRIIEEFDDAIREARW